MIYDFIKEIEETEVRDISLHAEPVKMTQLILT